jgi:dihydropteroate synthase
MPPADATRERIWAFSGLRWSPSALPRIMAIVNVTPDSFSDGGRWLDAEAAVEHALQLVAQGADIIDVGGESTRPGSLPVSAAEQLRRVIPVIERLAAATEIPISIDTASAAVAAEAIAAGARIVNDVTALTGDPKMLAVCAASDCGVIAMHMLGTPATMQNEPHYDDVVREVTECLRSRVAVMQQAGIAPERIVIDPGIGFGKTAQHNLDLLSSIPALHQIGRPVLIGHSRKRFLKAILGHPVEEATAGTIGVAISLAEQGADILRVHDVQAIRDALVAWKTVKDAATK